MPEGLVKWFDTKKGFGFISPKDGSQDIFVHFSAIEGAGFKNLKEGDIVTYEVVDSEKGARANNVQKL